MAIEPNKPEINEEVVRYQARTKLLDMATDIASRRIIDWDKARRASKVVKWCKALDYKEFLTKVQRQRIAYKLIEIAGINDLPTAPILEERPRPAIILNGGSSTSGGSGTVTSVDVTGPAAGISASGGPITSSGTISLSLTNDLAALEGLASTGLPARTATDTWALRTLTGTSNRLTVTNGDGVSGNPTFDISASYVGQASITTLGTITTGVWNGTAIGMAYGATPTGGSAGQILTKNTGTNYDYSWVTGIDFAGTLGIGATNATTVNLGTGAGNTNINIGTSGTNTIQIGNSNSTVNILGTVLYENVTNLQVKDKLFTVNKSGAAASGGGSGFEIEENGSITGYLKTTGGRDGYLFRAPANSADSSFVFTATSARQYTFQNFPGNVLVEGGTNSMGATIFEPSSDNTLALALGSSNRWGSLTALAGTFNITGTSSWGLTTSTGPGISATNAGLLTLSGGTSGTGTGVNIVVGSDAQGDTYFNNGTKLTRLAKDTNATRYLANTGTTNNPAWAQVDLTNGVTGVLPIVNGGTGTSLGIALSNIIAATGTNTINNAALAQEWQWNTLAAASGFRLSSSSTAAGSNLNKLFEVLQTGANGTTTQSTWAGYFSNVKTGTSSTNYAIEAVASGGTTNYAIKGTGWAWLAAASADVMAVGAVTPLSNVKLYLRGTGTGTNYSFLVETSGTTERLSLLDNGVFTETGVGVLGATGFTQNFSSTITTGGTGQGGFTAYGTITLGATTAWATAAVRSGTNITTGATNQIAESYVANGTYTFNHTGGTAIGYDYNPTIAGTQTASLTILAFRGVTGSLLIGGATITNASAIADFISTTKGLILPRVTNTASVVTPVTGMMIHDVALATHRLYQAGWVDIVGTTGLGTNYVLYGTGSQSQVTGEAAFTYDPSTNTMTVDNINPTATGGLGLLTAAPSFGGGQKVIFVANAGTVPTTNPTGGIILYSDAGILKYRDTAGNVITV